MTISSTKLAAAAAAALLLAGAAAPANAYYLGYGNGDPGNWDLWTEQNGGKTVSAPAPAAAHPAAVHHAHAHHKSTPTQSGEAKHS